MATGAELSYNVNASATLMANTIFGDGVTVVSASYTGARDSSAVYSNGQLAPGVVPSNTGVILSTGNVRDFTQSNGDPNRATNTSTDTSGPNNVAQFNAVAGTNTFDAAYLDVSFIPTGNMLTMSFVFASEEYPEYAGSIYNDMAMVFVNGSFVPMSFGSGQSGVTNISPLNNQNLFVSNTNDAYNTEMDGFTLTLTLNAPVIAGVVNTIRIAIVDLSDSQFDSNLLIAGDSAQTRLVAVDDDLTVRENGPGTIDLRANDVNATGGTLTVTHINGVQIGPGSVITLPSGHVITVNADGTITVTADADLDTSVFTYTVRSSTGATDVGMVKVTTIPCFVAGTRIQTPQGPVPVEALQPGDLVDTLDHGPQPLRWIGRRRVAAIGPLAPVRIAAGTFGAHGRLAVSPQHRILVRDSMADLLFGEAEVLVAAKDLVNGRTVTRRAGGEVEYVHLLFDRHQILWSEGLATESLLPGVVAVESFGDSTLDEFRALFPDFDPATGAGYGPAARRVLKPHEARVLFAPPAEVAEAARPMRRVAA